LFNLVGVRHRTKYVQFSQTARAEPLEIALSANTYALRGENALLPVRQMATEYAWRFLAAADLYSCVPFQ
jgi:hypothetical protein